MIPLKTLIFVTMFILPSSNTGSDKFSMYKPIEAYEVRPDVLMMPRYSVDGQICEIGLQKRNFSPELIRSDSELSRKELDEMFEELVPLSERGPRSKDFPLDVITQNGGSIVTYIVFEKVSMQVYSHEVLVSTHGKTHSQNVVAIIKWNDRKCQ